MKELDDISQEIAQLQRYMKAAPSLQIPNLIQILPKVTVGSIRGFGNACKVNHHKFV